MHRAEFKTEFDKYIGYTLSILMNQAAKTREPESKEAFRLAIGMIRILSEDYVKLADNYEDFLEVLEKRERESPVSRYGKFEKGTNMCICEREEWYEDSRIYYLNQWDHGYDFHEIKIKYCPVCGKKLETEEDDEPIFFNSLRDEVEKIVINRAVKPLSSDTGI